jgi:hypothetical protein
MCSTQADNSSRKSRLPVSLGCPRPQRLGCGEVRCVQLAENKLRRGGGEFEITKSLVTICGLILDQRRPACVREDLEARAIDKVRTGLCR